jgi:UDP-glucose:(heptosyl)LPS alpha-1,3-glucosyltransferase
VLGSDDPTDYRRLAERLHIASRVHFVGLYPQVEHYYAAADLCLLPTLSDPFPLVVLEAMACGLPVVTTTRQGVAELLRHGDNALLVEDPRDTRAIVEAIRALAAPDERRRIGRRARETVATLTWDRMTDEIEQLYRDVAGRSG